MTDIIFLTQMFVNCTTDFASFLSWSYLWQHIHNLEITLRQTSTFKHTSVDSKLNWMTLLTKSKVLSYNLNVPLIRFRPTALSKLFW